MHDCHYYISLWFRQTKAAPIITMTIIITGSVICPSIPVVTTGLFITVIQLITLSISHPPNKSIDKSNIVGLAKTVQTH